MQPPSPVEAALLLLDDGIAIVDAGTHIAFANPAMERMLGVEPRSLLGRDAREVIEPLGFEVSTLKSIRQGTAVAPQRFERLTGAATRTFEASLGALPDGSTLVRARDITAQHLAERRARAQLEENESFRVVACLLAEERDIRQVLELLSAQAASQCDADGATVIQVEGERGRAVATVGILEPLHGRVFRMVGTLAERVIRTRTPVTVDDFLVEYPHHVWSDAARETHAGPVMLAPLFAHDSLMGVVAMARSAGREPFTEHEIRRVRALADQAALALWKARLIEDAEAANRAKNDFIAVMSHELRTPLAAVAGYEELLADEILGPLNEEQHNAIDRMRWSIRLLASIIEEILTFSRLESGEMHLATEPVAVAMLLESAAAVLEPLATSRALTFSIHAPDDALEVDTDADVVRRVLVNLGSNAVKFTEQGGVELSATRIGDHVRFDVRDTGIGIAKRDLQRIFEAFTQLHTGTSRPYGGTGLGLHTAHRLAHLVGGEITVQSALGKGSTFSLLLPLRTAH